MTDTVEKLPKVVENSIITNKNHTQWRRLSSMEKMKAEGKVKTVTYQQLMSRKMMYQNMLSLYQIYGLVEERQR